MGGGRAGVALGGSQCVGHPLNPIQPLLAGLHTEDVVRTNVGCRCTCVLVLALQSLNPILQRSTISR